MSWRGRDWVFLMVLALTAGWPIIGHAADEESSEGKQEEPKATKDEGSEAEKGGNLYTAYTMWYEMRKGDVIMHSINYKTGAMIPAGTEVTDAEVAKGRKGILRNKPVIAFTTVKDGQTFVVQFRPDLHPGIDIDKHFKRMFTTKDLGALTKGMSQKEIEAIKQGKLVVGMSKKAVLVAYGPPPEHKTPSADSNPWIYWMNKFKTKEVFFDKEGKTTRAPAVATDEL